MTRRILALGHVGPAFTNNKYCAPGLTVSRKNRAPEREAGSPFGPGRDGLVAPNANEASFPAALERHCAATRGTRDGGERPALCPSQRTGCAEADDVPRTLAADGGLRKPGGRTGKAGGESHEPMSPRDSVPGRATYHLQGEDIPSPIDSLARGRVSMAAMVPSSSPEDRSVPGAFVNAPDPADARMLCALKQGDASLSITTN